MGNPDPAASRQLCQSLSLSMPSVLAAALLPSGTSEQTSMLIPSGYATPFSRASTSKQPATYAPQLLAGSFLQ
jgi:hypothetical protein